MQKKQPRATADVAGLEDKVDEYADLKVQFDRTKKEIEALDAEITEEVNNLVADAERNGNSVQTIRIPGRNDKRLDVMYTSRSKNIDPIDVDVIRDKLGDDVMIHETSVVLTGEAAKRFLEDAEKIDIHPQYDDEIVIKETTKLRPDFLARRRDLRRVDDEFVDELSKGYLYKPTFRVKVQKRGEVEKETFRP